MKQVVIYCIKVWLTTIVLPPVLITIGISLYHLMDFNKPNGDYIGFIYLMIVLGMAGSLMLWLIMLLILMIIMNYDWTRLGLKRAVLLICEVLIAVVMLEFLYFVTRTIDVTALAIWLFYALIGGIAMWFYELRPMNELATDDANSE